MVLAPRRWRSAGAASGLIWAVVGGLLACAAFAAPGPTAASAPAGNTAHQPPHLLPTDHLANVVRLTSGVFSGGGPEGDAAFAELKRLGVRTIVSVDGATPDRAAAERHGLRYVHLPHGYDGISDARRLELAKAVRELPGPIYIHCHHGRHRSPAAAAAACVVAGTLAPDEAMAVLQLAGTSANYRGLFQAVYTAAPVAPGVLDAMTVHFLPRAPVPPLAEIMTSIEQRHDALAAVLFRGQGAGSGTKSAAAEAALLLREHYTELCRRDELRSRPPAFVALLQSAESRARDLEQRASAWAHAAPPEPPPQFETPAEPPSESTADDALRTALDTAFERVSNDCRTCHGQFRDPPR